MLIFLIGASPIPKQQGAMQEDLCPHILEVNRRTIPRRVGSSATSYKMIYTDWRVIQNSN